MANQPNAMPITMDTDANSWFAIQTLRAQTNRFGLRVWKLSLVATAATVAGTINIVDPNDNTILLAPMVVPAAQAVGTVLFYDNPTQLFQWRDFKVTGLTATNTRLFIWYR